MRKEDWAFGMSLSSAVLFGLEMNHLKSVIGIKEALYLVVLFGIYAWALVKAQK